MSETLKVIQSDREDLRDRQVQFASVLGVEPEALSHLQFCESCVGLDYVWTDWSMLPLPDGFTSSPEDAVSYRYYLSDIACSDCDATGFQGGSFKLTVDQWLALGLNNSGAGQ